MTKLSSHVAVRRVRVRGGNSKFRALRLDHGNYSWGSEVRGGGTLISRQRAAGAIVNLLPSSARDSLTCHMDNFNDVFVLAAVAFAPVAGQLAPLSIQQCGGCFAVVVNGSVEHLKQACHCLPLLLWLLSSLA
jgi:hypothetical protein